MKRWLQPAGRHGLSPPGCPKAAVAMFSPRCRGTGKHSWTHQSDRPPPGSFEPEIQRIGNPFSRISP